jgi:hypothetical protein
VASKETCFPWERRTPVRQFKPMPFFISGWFNVDGCRKNAELGFGGPRKNSFFDNFNGGSLNDSGKE